MGEKYKKVVSIAVYNIASECNNVGLWKISIRVGRDSYLVCIYVLRLVIV